MPEKSRADTEISHPPGRNPYTMGLKTECAKLPRRPQLLLAILMVVSVMERGVKGLKMQEEGKRS